MVDLDGERAGAGGVVEEAADLRDHRGLGQAELRADKLGGEDGDAAVFGMPELRGRCRGSERVEDRIGFLLAVLDLQERVIRAA